MEFMQLFTMSLAASLCSITIARAKIFIGLRIALGSRSEFLRKLINCPYCLSHWIGFAITVLFVLFYGFKFPDTLWYPFAVIGLANVVSVFILAAIHLMDNYVM